MNRVVVLMTAAAVICCAAVYAVGAITIRALLSVGWGH